MEGCPKLQRLPILTFENFTYLAVQEVPVIISLSYSEVEEFLDKRSSEYSEASAVSRFKEDWEWVRDTYPQLELSVSLIMSQ